MSEIKSISVNNVKQTIEIKKSILNGRILETSDMLIKYILYISILINFFMISFGIFLGVIKISFGKLIELFFIFIMLIYGLFYATAGFGKGLVFIGDDYIAFPRYYSHIDSNGEADNYFILKKGEFDLDYTLKGWKVHSGKDGLFITEETAYAICKYVLQSEDLCEYKKKEGKQGSRQHTLRHLM